MTDARPSPSCAWWRWSASPAPASRRSPARHFAPTEVLSSDFFRGLVADDENDQSATADAFDALHYIAGKRLRGRPADRRRRHQRAAARAAGAGRAGPRARRAAGRDRAGRAGERVLGAQPSRVPTGTSAGQVLRRQHRDLRRSLRGWAGRASARCTCCAARPRSTRPRSSYERLYNDRGPDRPVRHHRRRARLPRASWSRCSAGSATRSTRDAAGRAGRRAPPGRAGRAVFVGDLVDRGPDTPGVLRLVMGMVAAGHALCVRGNHEAKLLRALRGREGQRRARPGRVAGAAGAPSRRSSAPRCAASWTA